MNAEKQSRDKATEIALYSDCAGRGDPESKIDTAEFRP